MIFWIADDHDAPAAGFDFIAFRNAIFCVVGSLGVKVRPNLADDRANVLFRKDDDGIDIRKRGQNFCALIGGHNRPSLSLQTAHRIICVYGDHQLRADRMRRVQIADVPNVKDVETAVGQGNALASVSPL